jgi:MYXO-CTERM domain-containing protein
VGFDFPIQPPPAFIGDPMNIEAGETSTFLVVRTNSRAYGNVQMVIDGAGTSFARTFAAVPEPGSMIFGLALLGALGVSRRRTQRA